MTAEIVQDVDVDRLEDGNELLLDIGAETRAVDRPVEDARGCKLVAAQGAKEGQRPPVAMGRKAPDPLALGPPSTQRRHAGLDSGLVDEDKPPWIEAGLPGPPAAAAARDIGAGLLKGEQCFF